MKKSQAHRGIPRRELRGSAKVAKLYSRAAKISAKMTTATDVQFAKLIAYHGVIMSMVFRAQLAR